MQEYKAVAYVTSPAVKRSAQEEYLKAKAEYGKALENAERFISGAVAGGGGVAAAGVGAVAGGGGVAAAGAGAVAAVPEGEGVEEDPALAAGLGKKVSAATAEASAEEWVKSYADVPTTADQQAEEEGEEGGAGAGAGAGASGGVGSEAVACEVDLDRLYEQAAEAKALPVAGIAVIRRKEKTTGAGAGAVADDGS